MPNLHVPDPAAPSLRPLVVVEPSSSPNTLRLTVYTTSFALLIPLASAA